MTNNDNRRPELTDSVARSLAVNLRQHLQRRYRLLRSDHDDLVQETLADLVAYIGSRTAHLLTEGEMSAIAFSILKRRIADRFRATLRHAIDTLPPEQLPSITEPHETEVIVRYRKLLWAVLSVLLDLEEEDQQLILRGELVHDGPERALTPAERKRVSRIRERLREGVRARFGISPEDYFKG